MVALTSGLGMINKPTKNLSRMFFPALRWTKVVLTLKASTFTIHKQNDCVTVGNTKGTSKSSVDC